MKGVRIALLLIIGVCYVVYTTAHPENVWMARGVALLAMVGVGLLTWLVAGKEAATSSPLEADPMPSLGLTQASYERDTASRADAEKS